MQVFLVQGDWDYVTASCEEATDLLAILSYRNGVPNAPLSPDFHPEMRFYYSTEDEAGIVTDFPDMLPTDSLVLSGRAVAALEPLLKASGKLYGTTPTRLLHLTLPMKYELFVCGRELDAIDHERSEKIPHRASFGDFEEYSRFAFKPEVVRGAGIFRAARVLGKLFVTEPFVEIVERERLSGLQVKPVWSEAEGPLEAMNGETFSFGPFPPGCSSVAEKRAAMREFLDGRRARQLGWR